MNFSNIKKRRPSVFTLLVFDDQGIPSVLSLQPLLSPSDPDSASVGTSTSFCARVDLAYGYVLHLRSLRRNGLHFVFIRDTNVRSAILKKQKPPPYKTLLFNRRETYSWTRNRFLRTSHPVRSRNRFSPSSHEHAKLVLSMAVRSQHRTRQG